MPLSEAADGGPGLPTGTAHLDGAGVFPGDVLRDRPLRRADETVRHAVDTGGLGERHCTRLRN